MKNGINADDILKGTNDQTTLGREDKNMIDLNYMKKAYSDFNTDKLIELFLVKTEDLIPEALSVIKEEFEKRGVEINRIWEEESLKSGSTEFLINNAIHVNAGEKVKIMGDLYLTSKGIYFIPVKYTDPVLFMYLGTLAMPANAIKNKLSLNEENIGKNRQNIIPSLLARYVKDSYEGDIGNVESIIYAKAGGLRTFNKDGEIKDFSFDRKNVSMLETWINTHGIKHEIKERFFGVMYLT